MEREELRARIAGAWAGRISGCQLGKPVELLSMRRGRAALADYLTRAGARPLRDYVPWLRDALDEATAACCKGRLVRAEPDDDINYSVLALLLLEEHGADLTTADVARAWLGRLPAWATFTAERAAYTTLLQKAKPAFQWGGEPGFDLAECAQNPWNDWIGAQIRADVYGWVSPGRPALAARLATADASLSHVGDGIHGAVFVAAAGAVLCGGGSVEAAIEAAQGEIPKQSQAAEAIRLGRELAGEPNAVERLHARYADLSPVHTVNNLALVVWALVSGWHDFSRAIGDAVAAGWDTDCNGATVGGLWGLSGRAIPGHWTAPWGGRVATTLAGTGELALEDLVNRTVAVAERIAS
jgi:ADP-ribosylglycohydrolase